MRECSRVIIKTIHGPFPNGSSFSKQLALDSFMFSSLLYIANLYVEVSIQPPNLLLFKQLKSAR